MSDRLREGMRVRRAVLGDAHVDRAEAAKTDFDEPFQTYAAEAAWGSVWARDGLSCRERALITLALLASLGAWEEFVMHIRATARTGATPEDVREALLHVAVYAGAPAANRAFALAKETYGEMGVAV